MKIISKKVVTIVHIEYELSSDARMETFAYLDAKYGPLDYQIMRSGPKGDGSNKGLLIIHADCSDLTED